MDAESRRVVKRTIREIERRKIEKPENGQTVGLCHWSKTGYAIYNPDGSCTCKPARKPKEAACAESN